MRPSKAPWSQNLLAFFRAWGYACFSGWLMGAAQTIVGALIGGGLGAVLCLFGVAELGFAFLSKGRGFDDPAPGSKPSPTLLPWSRRSARIFSCFGILALSAMQCAQVGEETLGTQAASFFALACAALAGFCASMSPKTPAAPPAD